MAHIVNGAMKCRPRKQACSINGFWPVLKPSFPRIDPVRPLTSPAQALSGAGSGREHGIACTASPDCPDHAGSPDSASTGSCGGLTEYLLTRMRGTYARPGQGIYDDSSLPERCRGYWVSRCHTRGCICLLGSPTATDHSRSSRKRFPVIGKACRSRKPSSRTLSRTACSEPAASSIDTYRNKSWNRIGSVSSGPAGSGDQRTAGRRLDRSWWESSFAAWFANFSKVLVEQHHYPAYLISQS